MIGLVDLHSHVLPALDDGARNEAESRALLHGLRELGYVQVVATPHARPGLWDPPDDEVRRRHAALRPHGEAIGLTLELGAEHYWDERIFRVDRQRLRAHADGTALLIEVPTQQTPPGLEEACFRLRLKGYLPLLAHPERYPDLLDDDERLAELTQHAVFVVDLGSLAGSDGFRIKRAARRLLTRGLARAVATDVHRPEDLEDARAGLESIRKKLGEPALARLARDNPLRLLAGQWPDEGT